MESSRKLPKGKKISIPNLIKKWPYAQLEISLHYEAATIMPTPFNGPEIAYDYLLNIWDKETIDIQEEFVALFLNRNCQLIGHRKLSRGDTHSTSTCKKLICAIGLICLADGVIVAHNHPSQKLMPSNADLRMTASLRRGLADLDIALLDSMIITKNGYVSIAVPGIPTDAGLYTQCITHPSVY